MTVGSTMVAVAIMSTVAVLGAEVSKATSYPVLSIVRTISIADFFERIEAVWMAIFVGAAILGLKVTLWAVALGLAQVLGLREYRALVAPLAALLLPLSAVMFTGQVDQAAFTTSIFPFFALFVEGGLVTVIWLVALLRGKRG